ncbi:unnamed protein product [Camellia sinensis]
MHVNGRPPNVIARLMGLDGLPSQQPLHRQHKGFSKTYRQWTASLSSQRDGKPYEPQSNMKDSMALQECKDEYEVLEISKVERSNYPRKRTINSKPSEAKMAFTQQKFMADHGTFGQVMECLDSENLERLAMMERLLGPLPQHMIISAYLRAKKYFKRSARLDWLEGASSKESTRAVWKLPRLQNCKFKCFSGILCCLLCIGSLLTQPSVPTTDIPTTTTTTFENPKKNFKTKVKTPGVVTRLMGLDSLPDPRKIFRRKEDQKEKRLNGATRMCKDKYEVLETSKVERSSYPAKRTINSKLSEAEMALIQQKFMAYHGTFGQVLEYLDNENLEHLPMMERLLGPLPQHMVISVDLRAEKYFKRSAPLDWLEGASSKESTRAVWKLPHLQEKEWTFGQVLEYLDNENLEHLPMMERLLGPLPQHMVITFMLRNISRGVHTWIG